MCVDDSLSSPPRFLLPHQFLRECLSWKLSVFFFSSLSLPSLIYFYSFRVATRELIVYIQDSINVGWRGINHEWRCWPESRGWAKGIELLSSSCVCVFLLWMLGLLMMDIPFAILPSTSFYGKGNNIYWLADEGGLFFWLCDRQLSFYSVTRNENGKVSVETSGIDLRSLFFWIFLYRLFS